MSFHIYTFSADGLLMASKSLIDSEASTDPAVAVVRLGKSHGAMVRFPGNEDEDFKIMLGHLSSILEDLTRSKPCDHGLGC